MAVFFTMLISVFIGFNFLLIQNETSISDLNQLNEESRAKSTTINSQTDSIRTLNETVNELNSQISALNQQTADKDAALAELDRTVQEQRQALGARADLISKFKQSLDVETVAQQPREWIEFLNSGEYEKAYARCGKEVDSSVSSMILSEFQSYYQKNIGTISIRAIDVVTRGIPETVDNDLVVSALVDIATPYSLARTQALEEALIEAALDAARASGQNAESGKNGEGANPSGREGGEGEEGYGGEAEAGGGSIPESGGGDAADPEAGGGDVAEPEAGSGAIPESGGGDAAAPEAGGGSIPESVGGGAAAPEAGGAQGASQEPPGAPNPQSPLSESAIGAGNSSESLSASVSALYGAIGPSAALSISTRIELDFPDELEESIFKNGENQLFFLMNYKKEANDWEIIKITQIL
jgi:cell division protein FtsL